jgi:HrpA-like RNA helicase
LDNVDIDPELSCKPERDPFLRCLTSGLFLNVARLSVNIDGSGNKSSNTISNDGILAPYKTVRGGQPVHIHPSSVLFAQSSSRKLPEYVVYSELLITTKQYMRGVTVIEGSWLPELVPQLFKSKAAQAANLPSGLAAPSNKSNSFGGRMSTSSAKQAMLNDAMNFQTTSSSVLNVSEAQPKKRKLISA